MSRKLKHKVLASVLAVCMLTSAMAVTTTAQTDSTSSTSIVDLTTEYRDQPIGIDTDAPRFSWKMDSNLIGQEQTAYQVNLYQGEASGQPIWTTGKVKDDSSVAIQYDGEPLQPKTVYYWTVTIWDRNGETTTSEPTKFETGLGEDANWEKAAFLCLEESSSAPIFRTEQTLTGNKIASARLYITSLGAYQAYINGKQVGNVQSDGSMTYNHMSPGYGNTDVSLTYQTYDVTDLIDQSNVALSVLAGTGWYGGMGSTTGTPAVKAMLEISYQDGSTQDILTNTTDWKATLDGAITFNSIWDGETYDANKAVALGDYTQVGYDDSNWSSCNTSSYDKPIIASTGEQGSILDELEQHPISATVYTGAKEQSSYEGGEINVNNYYAYEKSDDALYNDGVDVTIVEKDKEIFDGGISLKAGQTMVIDLGQNMAAIPNFVFSADQGTTVTMRFAEMLNDGSKVYSGDYNTDLEIGNTDPDALYSGDGPKGSVYLKSLRTAKAAATYTFAGQGNETYQPAMTFFGYRYISLTATDDITIQSVRSRAISSVSDQTGFIETNNADVNQLISNARWGQLSNYFTIPTDCPQRNEREAWTGDAQVFSQTGLYNYDSVAFLETFQNMLSDNTMKSGFPGAVASNSFFSYLWATGWSDIEIILPWTLYLQTGDVSILEENWDAMSKYMDYLISHEREPYAGPKGSWMAFGDWLAFQGTSVELMTDAFYGYDTQIMVQVAEIMGETELAASYSDRFENIKQTFIQNHVTFNDDGSITVNSDVGTASSSGKGGVMEPNSQTSLLWMLKLGFYNDDNMKQQLENLLVENIKNENPDPDSVRAGYTQNTLAVGFLGSNVITPVLTDTGNANVAYDLLLQDEMPSWLFPVKQGATTIWERWNSYSKEDGFGHQEMNSFNHYSYGSVLEWMYKYMVGIASDTSNPGFKNVILQPTLDTGEQYNDQSRISQVYGSYDSYYGLIESNWTSEQGQLASYETVVPANTTATLYLPVSEEAVADFTAIDGITYVGMEEHNGQMTAKFNLEAGGYNFSLQDGKLVASIADGYVIQTNKSILTSVIEYADSAKASGEYDNAIESVQKSFDEALTNAKSVAENGAATQEEVDAAWKTLLNEIHKLGFVAGDKTELASLIAAAEEIDLSKYVEAGQAEFTTALEAAQSVYKDGDAMQAEINEVADKLLNAMLNLRYKADKSILEEVVAKANQIDANAYTAESYAVLEAALKDANAVLANENATQEEVDAAVQTVQSCNG